MLRKMWLETYIWVQGENFFFELIMEDSPQERLREQHGIFEAPVVESCVLASQMFSFT